MFQRITSISLIILSLIVLTSNCIGEAKTPVEPQRRYSHILSMDLNFSISGGTAHCYGSGRGRDGNATTTVTVTLQRRSSNSSSWSYVDSWSNTQKGTLKVIVDKDKSVSSGYDYRIRVKCSIKSSSGNILESDTMYSKIVSY